MYHIQQKKFVNSRCVKVYTQKSKKYNCIGDKTFALMKLSDKEFVREINITRKRFIEKFPDLTHLIFEYKKQCTLLDLDFWYTRPVPKRCERFVEMDIMTLMYNVDANSEEGKEISAVCDKLLRMYIEDYERYTNEKDNVI
jgi:hypothetical protein